MNPAQLLNPKAFVKQSKKRIPKYGPTQARKPQTSVMDEVKVHMPTYDPKALLNPKANGTPSVAQNRIQSSEDAQEVNMSHFYEKHHNVKNREAPVLKRKAEDAEEDGEQKKQKTTFQGGRGGIISDHLKQERDALAARAPTNTVDLTMEDDDVVITQEKDISNIEVCLGKLDVKAMCFQVPNISGRNTLSKDWWPAGKVSFARQNSNQDKVLEVVDNSKKPFGRIDVSSAMALCPLLDGAEISKIRMKPFLQARKRKEDEQAGQAISQALDVVLILYAPRCKALQIGKWLSGRNLFLQSPPHIDNGREYYNPQASKPDHRPTAVVNGTARAPTLQTTSYSIRTVEEKEQAVNKLFDNLAKNEDIPEMETDTTIIKTKLMHHQKQALHFLVDHEQDDPSDDKRLRLWQLQTKRGREIWHHVITGQEINEHPKPCLGGILADMMGLGKTLSILALIATTQAQSKHFLKSKLPEQIRSVGVNSKATLIVCPKSVLSNWEEQVQSHAVAGKLKHYVYHGANRSQDLDALSKIDIVLTSYGTLAMDYGANSSQKQALMLVNWHRVVLDEAHTIRNTNTASCKAACALHAQKRWAVTGTPVQNRLEDLGALIRFLKVKPFDEQQVWAQYITSPFKTASTQVLKDLRLLVDSITLRRMKDIVNMSARTESIVRLEFSTAERMLYSAFAARSNLKMQSLVQETKGLRGKSYSHVLKALGRLRMICCHGKELLDEDDMEEIKGYDTSHAIELGDEPGIADQTFTTARQAYEVLTMQHDGDMDICLICSKHIITDSDATTPDPDTDESDDEEATALLGYLTPCLHLLHEKCYRKHLEKIQPDLRQDGYYTCPHCESYVRNDYFALTGEGLAQYKEDRATKAKLRKKQMRLNPETYTPSTKVQALIAELQKSAKETVQLPAGEPPIRSVVFTEWTSYLDLIEVGLENASIHFARLDGSMTLPARSKVLQQFKNDPDIAVMLVSIKAGGQGINLTSANKVYIMDPTYNPGVEHQAVDRVHRLGQTRDVQITHFIMTDSVEEGIIKLQDKKIKLANLSMEKKRTGDVDAKKQIEELRDLFK